jgi:Predicted RNA-binding protein (consists of S1 domain and a Zn-ribbon domain)
MIYQNELDGYILFICDKCGKSHTKHKGYCKQYGDEYHFNPPITCTCGNTQKVVYKESSIKSSSPVVEDNNGVKCPNCGSTQIAASSKGFGLGKAAAGGLLFGAVGLLGGFIGSNKVMVTCLKCGSQWKAGKV